MDPGAAVLAETIPGVPDQLTGPVAALVLAIIVIVVLVRVVKTLWEDHLRRDQVDHDEHERTLGLLEASVANNKASVAAWDRRTAADAARRRKADSP